MRISALNLRLIIKLVRRTRRRGYRAKPQLWEGARPHRGRVDIKESH